MENKLKEYAKLLVEVGVNIQKGQTLLLFAPVDQAPFARMCADVAYENGCREVVIDSRTVAVPFYENRNQSGCGNRTDQIKGIHAASSF